MPKHPGNILNRLSNFAKGAKHLLEHLSLWKTHKQLKIDASDALGKEAMSFTSLFSHEKSSIYSRLSWQTILQSDPNEDIFSSPPNGSSNIHFFLPQTALKEPTEAPQAFYSEFSLPPIWFPKATVEDYNKDDCDSVTSDRTDILSDHSKTRSADGNIPNGKMQMVPSMLMAEQALIDVNTFLCGKTKGKGGGFHAPKLDPFIQSRMEVIRTFLNLFTSPNSSTYNKWAASSLQASMSIGHGTYCAQQLQKLAHGYIADCSILPINPYGN